MLVKPLLALAAAGLLAGGAAAATADVVTRFVMRINDEVATLHEYEKRRAELERIILERDDLTLQQRREALEQTPERVFRQMYEELLLLSRARQLGITVSDQQVEEQLVRIREQMGLRTDQEFQQALAMSGMTLEELREQARRSLLSQSVIGREVYSQIDVDEEILRRYYRDNPDRFMVPERLRLREVVVLEDKTPDAGERLRLAEEIRAEVTGGRGLDEVAEEREEGGLVSGLIDVGWISAGDLSAELEGAVWGLQAGQISEPIAARGGTHLVEVVAREPAALKPFAEVEEEVRDIERQRRATEEFEEYFTRLENEAFVRLDPPPGAEFFRRLTAEPLQGPGDLLAPAQDGTAPDGTAPDGAAPEGAPPGAPDPAAEEPPAVPEGVVPTAEEMEAGGDPGEPVPPSSPEPPPPGGPG